MLWSRKICSFKLCILVCAKNRFDFVYTILCVLLYPNYSPGTGRAFIIRKASSHTGTFESICALSCGKSSQQLLLLKETQARFLRWICHKSFISFLLVMLYPSIHSPGYLQEDLNSSVLTIQIPSNWLVLNKVYRLD